MENSHCHNSAAKQDGLYYENENVHFLPLLGLFYFLRSWSEFTIRVYVVGGNSRHFCTMSCLSCFKVFLSGVFPFLNCRYRLGIFHFLCLAFKSDKFRQTLRVPFLDGALF